MKFGLLFRPQDPPNAEHIGQALAGDPGRRPGRGGGRAARTGCSCPSTTGRELLPQELARLRLRPLDKHRVDRLVVGSPEDCIASIRRFRRGARHRLPDPVHRDRHVITNFRRLEGDRVNAYLTLIVTDAGETVIKSAGIYEATVAEEDGELKLSSFVLSLDRAF